MIWRVLLGLVPAPCGLVAYSLSELGVSGSRPEPGRLARPLPRDAVSPRPRLLTFLHGDLGGVEWMCERWWPQPALQSSPAVWRSRSTSLLAAERPTRGAWRSASPY